MDAKKSSPSASVFEHATSILALPFTVTVVIPYFLPTYHFSPTLPQVVSYGVGTIFLSFGAPLFVQSVILFVKIGRGTLAPWNPTRKLVVRSLYRHMRNPMISGVFLILLAEAFLFRSVSILVWAGAFLLINHIYFIAKEEPDLVRRFGDEYREYKRNVPRWIPRLKGWQPEDS